MLENPSLTTRIAIGKIVGFVIGLIGFLFLPYCWPEAPLMIRWGILLWYTTVGAVIGLVGVVTWHPVFRLPMPWWFRAPIMGGWMNFVLTFFAYDMMHTMLTSIFGSESSLSSPYWFVVEGALVGLLIGYLATKFGGEGRETV